MFSMKRTNNKVGKLSAPVLLVILYGYGFSPGYWQRKCTQNHDASLAKPPRQDGQITNPIGHKHQHDLSRPTHDGQRGIAASSAGPGSRFPPLLSEMATGCSPTIAAVGHLCVQILVPTAGRWRCQDELSWITLSAIWLQEAVT